jgi:hypothetical protein
VNNLYKYSLEYDANGVGELLFEDFKLRLEGDPRSITFLILCVSGIPISLSPFTHINTWTASTMPTQCVPAGASHKLRVWLRSLVPISSVDPTTSYALPFNDSYIYQRVWKCDAFKIGSRLDFESLGPKMVMAFSSGLPETIMVQNPAPDEELNTVKALYKEKKGYGF